MKRGLSGKTRRGSPPLPRQRKALRVVQLTLLGIAAILGALALAAWSQYRHPLPAAAAIGQTSTVGLGELVVLVLGVLAFFGLAVAMGVRVVRGPEPDEADFE
ncbi:MAG TPA: hypothetical protein VHA57_05805 [Actinomycetota bacterium]|nr:hypothetical protein [Actinomycetota bacterium]